MYDRSDEYVCITVTVLLNDQSTRKRTTLPSYCEKDVVTITIYTIVRAVRILRQKTENSAHITCKIISGIAVRPCLPLA